MPSLKLWLLGAVLLAFVAMGVGLYWQHSTISSQRDTLAKQQQAIDDFKKDKAGQEKADKQLKADKEKIAKERDKFRRGLEDALRDNGCSDVPFDSDTQRLLQDLYNSQGSR